MKQEKRFIDILKSPMAMTFSAFLIPILILLLILVTKEIYPLHFSEYSARNILTIDANNQYVSFFSYYTEILKGNADFTYTFSKTLGGDMAGLSAYYLMSPLNLILLFFSTEQLPVAVMIQTLLKIGLCGLTFQLFLYSRKPSYITVFLSAAYALMGYNIAYHHNIMWLDGVILLPLVIWGIHRLFEGKSVWMYLFSLFAAIFTNYYIGYMICIFSVLYFLYCIFSNIERKNTFGKLIAEYTMSSLLAGGLCAFLLIPVFKSLQGGKSTFALNYFTLTPNFNLSDFFSKFLIGSFDYEQAKYGLPVVYCGIVSLLFVFVYFLSSKITIRKKVSSLVLLAVLFLSFYFQGSNLVWHGMNITAWFPYRYSFIFTFFVLLLAFEGWHAFEGLSSKKCIIAFTISGLSLIGILIGSIYKNLSFMSNEKYLINAIVILTALIFFVLLGNRFREIFRLLLCLLLMIELGLNGMLYMNEYSYADNEEYTDFIKDIKPVINKIEEQDQSFYRIEKTFARNLCDPMLLNYKGLSHYSSSEKAFVKDFMGKMGFRSYKTWAHYSQGSSFAMDALLGVKYVLSTEPIGSGYVLQDTIGDIQIYRNEYALTLGYMVDEAAINCSIDEDHKFELQNHIWQSMSTQYKTDTIFNALDIQDIELYNLTMQTTDKGTNFVKVNQNKKAYIEYQVTAKNDDPIFAFFTTDEEEIKGISVTLNGESKGDFFAISQSDIIRLGEHNTGDVLKIRLELKEDYVYINDAWIYTQNMNVFQNYYQELSKRGIEITSFTNSKIMGTVQSDGSKQFMMFTIPYETAWNVWVDGKKVNTIKSLDTFLTIPLSEGTHEIVLKYIPEGMTAGFVVSVCCIGIIAIWMLKKRLGFKTVK